MSHWPSVTARETVAALKRAGFEAKRQRGSHLILFHAKTKRIVTVPMHKGDLPTGTIRSIVAQSGLDEEEFLRLL
ncbi:MAG: addiction module toxin, HicA family [Candidatus Hydrogenedens sp.]|nr:addiction module toxin, HicA family [Candidatus Hydrogenedens sp.]